VKTLQPAAGVTAGYLAACPAFAELTGDERLQLAAEAYLQSYDKGERIFTLGEPASQLVCLVQGSARVYRVLPDGREKVIHLVGAPSLIAEAPTLTGGHYPSSADCTTECLIVAIARTALLSAAQRSPDLPWRMMGQLFSRLRELTQSLESHSQQSGAVRVASFLIGLGHGKDAVDLPAAKKDVANYLGLRAESFSRALKALQAAGAIEVTERQIRIVDRERLEGVLAE
jgi:CRP/FNR family transcriptional regulator